MNPLNASQVHILQALLKAPDGLDRAALATMTPTGTALNAANLGPVGDESLDRGNNSDSLRARGLVDVTQEEDGPVRYWITKEGRVWAKRSSARVKMSDDQRIPNAILDKAVLAIRQNKAYSFEVYTPADIEEIRLMCASNELHGKPMVDYIMEEVVAKYAAITDDNIRDQMMNRRKQGAYTDPDAKVKADLVKLGKLLTKFNVSIDPDSEEALDELCDNHDLPPIMSISG